MIYFIGAGKNGPIKIGHTRKTVESRMAGLQTGNPEKLHLLASHEGSTLHEKLLHTRFANYRLEGEWFERLPVELFLSGKIERSLDDPNFALGMTEWQEKLDELVAAERPDESLPKDEELDTLCRLIETRLHEPVVFPGRLAITRAEACDALGISLDHFERHIQSDVRLIRTGRRLLVPIKELNRWIKDTGAVYRVETMNNLMVA